MERILFYRFLVVCLMLTPFGLVAQDYTVEVQHIDVADGLLHRDVQKIFEDRNGLIWIGASKGLQRYDGHQFKTWTKSDRTGLLYYISAIAQDDEGWLWLWNNDLFRFVFMHPETEEILTEQERFGEDFPIYVRKGDPSSWNSSSYIPKINGQLKFGTRDGKIISYDSKQGFQSIQLEKGISAHIAYSTDEHLWIQSNSFVREKGLNLGLYKIDLKGNILASFPLEFEYIYGHFCQFEGVTYCLLQSRFPNIKFQKQFQITADNQISESKFEYSLDKELIILGNQFWLRERSKNWQVYEQHFSNKIFELTNEDHPTFLFDSSYKPLLDSRGIIWSYGEGGIYKISSSTNRFKNYFSFEENEKKPFANEARGIWVTKDSIIVNFERSNTVSLNKNDPKNWTIISTENWARPLTRKPSGELWIGYPFSLKVKNPSGNIIQEFAPVPGQAFNGMWSFYEDKNKRLWIGTGDNLNYINKEDSTIQRYQSNQDTFGFTARRGAIQNMIASRDGNVWFCSWTGLYLFDPIEEKILARYASDEKGKYFLPADLFYFIYEDEEGIKWIGTADGLIRWDSEGGTSRLFNRTDGFSNDVIYAIFEDDYNRLWMSSDYGIISFDKETFHAEAYLPKDGTSHHEFNRTSQFKSADGTMYFGGLNGITSFHPKDFIEQDKDFAKMQILDFEIFDGEEEKLVNRVGELRSTQSIRFNPNDRFFRLKFVLPTFADATQLLYAWKIEGIDKDWNYQKENTLQIGTLPYGHHQLRIKGQSGGGGWSPHELNISVDVRRPFYLQTWFIILAILSLIAGVLGFLRVRTQVLKREIDNATIQIQKDKSTIEEQAIELQKLDKLKSRFFANVSHELRTPLSLMLGPINQLIKKNGHDPKERKLLEFIQRNSLHLKKLVNEILDLSKLENNKLELKEEAVNFYPYIKNHIAQYYSMGSSENITFAAEFPEESDLNILLDKNKFEKVINNYLSNALKFTPPGGKVMLNVQESEQDIIFTVSDNGRGIHPEDLPFVFDRFFQTNREDAPTEGGTGIGLSFSKELAQLMGGKVWAESTLGQGSKFHFQFPLKKVDPTLAKSNLAIIENGHLTPIAASEIPSDPINSKFKQAKILIAEDNKDLREYYKIILADFQVILTENGQAALDYLESTEGLPNLIISDLMMPVMDGIQFLEKVKSATCWRNIPVVMLTAKSNRVVKLKALRIGIDDYITKPFDDEELLVRIENLLDHYNSRLSFQEEEKTNKDSNTVSTISREEMQWLIELEQFVVNNLGSDILTVELLSREFAMSKSTLLRQLRKTTGLSPSKYIQEHRLNIARELLENREYKTVAQVAAKVGFKNANAFSRSFKNRFGNTPTEMLVG